jgi:hypothetical protein
MYLCLILYNKKKIFVGSATSVILQPVCVRKEAKWEPTPGNLFTFAIYTLVKSLKHVCLGEVGLVNIAA